MLLLPLAPLRRSRALQVALAAVFLSFLSFGFIPQFAGPGYEAALAAGLVLPALSALAAAFDLRGRRVPPLEAFGRGMSIGACGAGLGLCLVLAHGLRVGFCDALWGVELYLLGPFPGALLAGVWGASIGLVAAPGRALARRPALLAIAALGAPLGGIAVSLLRFYTSPMVFAFDPFFGYFSGPLYDTVIDPFATLATYRIGTGLTLLALGGAAAHFDEALRFTGLARQPWLSGVALAALATSLGLLYHGAAFGHYSTRASIEAALGQALSGERCDVEIFQHDLAA